MKFADMYVIDGWWLKRVTCSHIRKCKDRYVAKVRADTIIFLSPLDDPKFVMALFNEVDELQFKKAKNVNSITTVSTKCAKPRRRVR